LEAYFVAADVDIRAHFILEETSEKKEWKPSRFRDLLNDPQYGMVMMAAAIAFGISAFIHFPTYNSPSFYSDFVWSFWGRSHLLTGIPYVNYMFEYPPICGLIVWTGGWLSYGSRAIFVAIEFAILAVFMLLTAHYTYQFMGYLGLSSSRQLIYSIFTPSIIFYGAYNFDLVQAFFVVLALYFLVARRKENQSAIALGLAVATKLSPALLVPFFLQEIKGTKKRITFSAIAAAVTACLNAPFMLANFSTWLQGYQYVKNWGLEDSFMVWVVPQSSWGFAKDVLLALLGSSTVAVIIFARSKPFLVRIFMASVIFIVFSYIASPQLNVGLLPLFALVPLVPLSLFYLLEIANAGIILTWFACNGCTPTLPGTPQIFALVRQIYLFFILGILAFSKKQMKR
jgi:hypothetical protein